MPSPTPEQRKRWRAYRAEAEDYLQRGRGHDVGVDPDDFVALLDALEAVEEVRENLRRELAEARKELDEWARGEGPWEPRP
jgi:hypothetical protein